MFRKKGFKAVILVLTMFLVLGMLAGCGGGTDDTSDTTANTDNNATDNNSADQQTNSAYQDAENALYEALAPLPEKDTGVKLAAIESTLANSFWVTMQEGYEAAAEEYGVTIDVMATDTETDIQGQLDIMNTLLVKDYSAIAVSPLTENNLIPGIVSANEKGVKIVAVGNGVDEDALAEANGSIEAFITSDFKAQGTMGAEYIIEKTGGQGKVAIIEGMPGGTQSEARKNGAKEAFEAAGMEILPIQTGNWDRQTAYDLTAALIDANPDLVGICCGNDVMALGAVEALKAKGVKDNVMVVGVDFIEEARDSIKAGELDATVAMSPYLFGKAGVLMALKAVQGQEITDDVVWTPLMLVTADTVDSMEGWK